MLAALGFPRIARAGLVAGLAVALSAAAGSQPAAKAGAEDSIVVTGARLTPEEIEKRAEEFVRGLGIASGQTPAARWADPVCPHVSGLGENQARTVEAKMRAIARVSGIKVAGRKCQANIVVSFAADAAAEVREIARRSRRLAQVPPGTRAALLESAAAIRWWYSTDTRTRHNMRARGMPPTFLKVGGQTGGEAIPSSVPTSQHYDSSVVSTQANRVLTSASVIIDADGAAGLSLDSLASYAALVAFAEIRNAEFVPPSSILSLFSAPSAPRELTEQDIAFLRALYRLPLDRPARRHRGALVREIVAAHKAGG